MNNVFTAAMLLLRRAGSSLARHLGRLPWEACANRMLRLL